MVGDLEVNFEAMEFRSDPGLAMVVYTAPAGSPSADARKLLASFPWDIRWSCAFSAGRSAEKAQDQGRSLALASRPRSWRS
ncbi:hypothetical protein AB0L70_27340 [Kribbella sp. NPDC051952]|uniref:hypothetical protein n=1 Tax=Kribbella sp. NPDC051952 TaxID=3154851 RepID=UPI0034338D28